MERQGKTGSEREREREKQEKQEKQTTKEKGKTKQDRETEKANDKEKIILSPVMQSSRTQSKSCADELGTLPHCDASLEPEGAFFEGRIWRGNRQLERLTRGNFSFLLSQSLTHSLKSLTCTWRTLPPSSLRRKRDSNRTRSNEPMSADEG